MDAKKIGERLKELRESLGQSKRYVAKAIGISYSGYCQYEYGLKIPGDETKIKISSYFGVPVGRLFYSEQ